MHTDPSDHPFGSAEPARDAELGALLRRVTGDVPMGAVDWDGLAARISRAVPARAVAPWWSYATRWERRMLPIALAAGLLGAFALWGSAPASMPLAISQSSSSDAIAEMVTGASVSDVATSYERAMLSDTGFEESLAE